MDYAAEGRRRKVLKLAGVVDIALQSHGIGPYTDEAAQFVANFSDSNWRAAIAAAKVNEPSAETRAALVKFYADRAAEEKAYRKRAVADYAAEVYKQGRDARVARRGGLR